MCFRSELVSYGDCPDDGSGALDPRHEFPRPLTDGVAAAPGLSRLDGCADSVRRLPRKRYLAWALDDPDGHTPSGGRPRGANGLPERIPPGVLAYPPGYMQQWVDARQKGLSMCYPVPCPICDKIAWAGCDRHVDDVTKDVSRPRQWHLLC